MNGKCTVADAKWSIPAARREECGWTTQRRPGFAGQGSIDAVSPESIELAPEYMRAALRDEGQRCVAAARNAPEHAQVVGASGRTARQTVQHLGDVCTEALARLTGSSGDEQRGVALGQVDMSTCVDRLVNRLAELLAEFGTRSPWETCTTWWPADRTIRFWLRRVLHATTVHRVDMQTAADIAVTPVPEYVAEDGVAEALRLWFEYRLSDLGVRGNHPSAVEVCTSRQRWLASVDRDSITVQEICRSAVGVDTTMSGDAERVYLWLWGRLPDRAVRVTGDLQAAAQLWGLLRLAMR